MAIVSGTGANNVDQAVHNLIRYDINAIISWGTCVALVPELKSGDLLLPEVLLADGGERYFTDKSWVERIGNSLRQERLHLHHGSMTSAQNVLINKKQKTDLHATTGALAADMESAAIVKTARSFGLPCIVIRAVLDEADTAIPETIMKHTDEFGKADVPGLLREIIQAPGLLVPLCELALSLHKAVRTLKIVARRTNGTLLCPTS